VATIATTTNASPFLYPGANLLCKQPGANRYIALVKASTADNYTLYKSTDTGASWASLCTVVRTNLVDVGSIFFDKYGWIIWAYRTNESSQDRIYVRVINSTSGAAVSEYLLASPGNGGVAGATYSGLDVVSHYTASAYQYVVVAVGTRIGSSQGVTLHAAYADNSGIYIPADGLISGTRRWMFTGAGSARIGPSIDKEHTGDGYTSSAPHLWISHGRDSLYQVKVPWTGSGWSGPTGQTLIYGSTGDDCTVGRWDGSRFLMCAPDPASTSQVIVLERNRANSTTTARHTPNHTTGVVRQATLAYNTANGNIRVFAVGTSTAVLYFIDYTRATDTWGAWTSTGLAAILGAGVDNFGTRVSTEGDARYGIYSAASGAPNTLTYTPQTVSYAPNTPTWTSPTSGGSADVGLPLELDWAFSDPDPGDTQSAYAISRQVGAGALSYWRASDSTWQVAEVQNTSGTSSITIPAGWAAGSDAVHTLKVKVWDSGSNASGYSAGLTVLPSTPVNPAITSPTAAQVIGVDHLTVVWTATEQTQYRVILETDPGAALNANPLFEVDATNWSPTGGTFVRSTAQFHQGAAAGLLTPDGVTATVEVGSELVAALPGAVYRISGWVRCAATRNVNIGMNWYDTVPTFRLAQVATFALTANTWTFIDLTMTAPNWAGYVQQKFQMTGTPPAGNLLYVDQARVHGTPAYDSGWVADTASRSLLVPYTLATGTAWMVTVYARNLEGLASQAASQIFTTNFIPPMTPTTVATPFPNVGIISVVITNPTPGGGAPALASQDLYRRVTGSGDPTGIRVAAGLANNATYLDWAAVSGVGYDYRAVVTGTNGTTSTGVFTA
jgi:hypothetical protein